MERARGSRAELPQRPRHFPSNEGQQDGIKLAAFSSGDIREPAPTSRRHFFSTQGDHFLQPPASSGFDNQRDWISHIAKLEETLIQYQKGPTVPITDNALHRDEDCSAKRSTSSAYPRVDSLSLESVGGSPD